MEITTDDSTDKDEDMKKTFKEYAETETPKVEKKKAPLSLEALLNPDKNNEDETKSSLFEVLGGAPDKSEIEAEPPEEKINDESNEITPPLEESTDIEEATQVDIEPSAPEDFSEQVESEPETPKITEEVDNETAPEVIQSEIHNQVESDSESDETAQEVTEEVELKPVDEEYRIEAETPEVVEKPNNEAPKTLDVEPLEVETQEIKEESPVPSVIEKDEPSEEANTETPLSTPELDYEYLIQIEHESQERDFPTTQLEQNQEESVFHLETDEQVSENMEDQPTFSAEKIESDHENMDTDEAKSNQVEARTNLETTESMAFPSLLSLAETITIAGTSLRTMYEQGRIDQEQLRRFVGEYLNGERVEKIMPELIAGQERLNEQNAERHKDDDSTVRIDDQEIQAQIFSDLGSSSLTASEIDIQDASVSQPVPNSQQQPWRATQKKIPTVLLVVLAIVTGIIIILVAT